MKLISLYTYKTPYQDIIKEYLLSSLEKINIDYKIYGLESEYNWIKNTNLKSKVVKQALEEFNDDILFVDADAKIYEYPKLLEELPEKYDAGMFWLNPDEWYHNGNKVEHICSGTIFFRNRFVCKELVNRWYELCQLNKKTDQRYLQDTVEEFGKRINIYKLPYSYCWIHNLPNGKEPFVKRPDNIIVEHFQCSRQLRRKI